MIAGALFIAILGVSLVLLSFVRLKILLSMFCFAGRCFAKIDKIGLPLFIHGAYNLIVLLYSKISFLSSTR